MLLQKTSFRFIRMGQHVGCQRFVDLALIVLPKGPMHHLNRQAARQHELAAKSHREASESHGHRDDFVGQSHADRALSSANRAYELARAAHDESHQIESL